MRYALALLILYLTAPVAHAQVGALQTNCKLGGMGLDLSYQFVATCAGFAPSPDGKLAIVQKAYDEIQPAIELQDAQGKTLTRLTNISDDMPFSVTWAPNSRWFFVNHHVGSFMDELHLYEIVGKTAVERQALPRSAALVAKRRYPCLPVGMVRPNGVRWSSDSRRIVLFTTAAPYACREFGEQPGDFERLWMIGDVASGRIERYSVRIQPDDKPLQMPQDGDYVRFTAP